MVNVVECARSGAILLGKGLAEGTLACSVHKAVRLAHLLNRRIMVYLIVGMEATRLNGVCA